MRRALLPAFALFATLAGGCNQVLGTGEPTIREQTGGAGGGGAGGDGGGGSGGDGGGSTGACYDPEWAQWTPRMEPDLVTTAEGWELDKVTGLLWSPDALPAGGGVSSCVLPLPEGYVSGPRLPTRIELLSLLDYGGSTNVFVPGIIGLTPGDPLRTSSTGLSEDLIWTVTPANIGLQLLSKEGNGAASLCVASKQTPLAEAPEVDCRYQTDGGWVKDLKTNLAWRLTAEGYPERSFSDAKGDCGPDARLPEIYELLTLLDVHRDKPAWPPVFGETPPKELWSSTPSPAQAMTVFALNVGSTAVTTVSMDGPGLPHLCVK